MTGLAIQLRKEARQLLWPWLTLTLIGLTSHLYRPPVYWDFFFNSLELLMILAVFLGAPLLAAFPLGSEFQHGTFTLLLAQPLNRISLWRQKIAFSAAAALPTLLFILAAGDLEPRFSLEWKTVVVWALATTSSAFFWTLLARSTLGGTALNIGFHAAAFALWSWFAQNHDSVIFQRTESTILILYSIGMILLGRRFLLRFQSTDGRPTELTLVPGLRLERASLIGWLRCRPRGATLNLIRREIGLLRTVWLLSAVSFVVWVLAVALQSPQYQDAWFANLVFYLGLLLSFLIALLAGALSLGEEKTSGTHFWHLTLPFSAESQWFTKLCVALSTTAVCAVGIPLILSFVRSWFVGAPEPFAENTPIAVWIVTALLSTLLSFWCASVVKGTVRAALCFFLVFFATGAALAVGLLLAQESISHMGALFNVLLSKVDLAAVNRSVSVLCDPRKDWILAFAGFFAPLLAFALIQSLRMFRGYYENEKFHITRELSAFLAFGLVAGFVLSVFTEAAESLRNRQSVALHEIHLAIQSLETDPNGQKLANVQTLSAAQLFSGTKISDATRLWLGNSTIVVRPESLTRGELFPTFQWPYEVAAVADSAPGKNALPYSATIRTARGGECNLRYRTSAIGQMGFLFEFCQ